MLNEKTLQVELTFNLYMRKMEMAIPLEILQKLSKRRKEHSHFMTYEFYCHFSWLLTSESTFVFMFQTQNEKGNNLARMR